MIMPHDKYKFINVWKSEDKGIRKEVIAFWSSLRALPGKVDAKERVNQVVYIVKADDEIIGVTTAQRKKIPRLNNNFLFNFRLLIHPKFRNPGLSVKVALLTRDFLESLYQDKLTDCIGMIVLIENEDMKKVRTEAVLKGTDMVFIGLSKNGHHVRVYYFKGAHI